MGERLLRRRFVPLCVALAASCLFALLAVDSQRVTATAALSQLRVTPPEGHTGDLIDLSGSGFPAYTHLNILMACPNWQAPNAVRLNNVAIIAGPETDWRGQFGGFLMRAIRLHEIPQSTCQIVASVGDNPFGVDIPAVYLIRQKGQALQLRGCKKRLCVAKLRVEPEQVRSGYDEKISVQTWPGATVTTYYSYPGNQTRVDRHRADWTGSARWTKPVTSRVPGPGVVQVRSTAALGSMTSTRTAKFTIVR